MISTLACRIIYKGYKRILIDSYMVLLDHLRGKDTGKLSRFTLVYERFVLEKSMMLFPDVIQ